MQPYFGEGLGGPTGDALIGSGNFIFLFDGAWALSGDAINAGVLAFFLYMVAFMDTVATIPTGAMAERWKWGSFVIWGLFCGAIYYPLFAAWTWGGGWLSKTWDSFGFGAGYVDFAGSGVVHAVGGAAALAGALVLGPRIGKYDAGRQTPGARQPPHPDGHAGHVHPAVRLVRLQRRLDVLRLRRPVRHRGDQHGIAAAFGAIVAMLFANWRMGKPDPGMMANGMLAGLVAITAPCAFVTPAMSAVIGGLAGILVVLAIGFVERRVSTIPLGPSPCTASVARSACSASGCSPTAATAAAWNGSEVEGVKGLFWGDAGQFAAQPLGVVVIWTVIFGVVFAFFKIQNAISKAMGKGGIRSKEDHELAGLDLPEMGVLAYPEFVGSHEPVRSTCPKRRASGRRSRRRPRRAGHRVSPLSDVAREVRRHSSLIGTGLTPAASAG